MSKFVLLGFMQKSSAPAIREFGFFEVEFLDVVAVLARKKKTSSFASKRKRLTNEIETFQKGLEVLLAVGPVIPSVFGQYYEDRLDVLPLIAGNAKRIRKLLETYGEKHQYQIEICWELDAAIKHYAPELKSWAAKAAEGASIAEKLQSGIEVIRQDLEAETLAILNEHDVEFLSLPRPDQNTVTSFVVAWNRDDESGFDQLLESIDAINTQQLRIKAKGPLPACSFASLKPVSVVAEEIKSACDLIGCSSDSGVAEIQSAFRAFIKKNHPDVGGDARESEEGVKAYRLLCDYAETVEELGKTKVQQLNSQPVMLRIHHEGEARKVA